MEITYIGYSLEMIRLLINSTYFKVICIITKEGVLSKGFKKKLISDNIYISEVDDNNIENIIKTRVCLIYKYRHIIKKNVIEQHVFFNIHPGSIRDNRGAHPVRWSILLGNKFTYMTLYRIMGIDEGEVIHECKLRIRGLNYLEVDLLMNSKIDESLKYLQKYFEKNESKHYKIVLNGKYRRKIEEKDYTIDLEKDTVKQIRRKINSVKDFGGAVLFINGDKYRAKEVLKNKPHKELEKAGDEFFANCDSKKWVIRCETFKWK